jgi:hypothetical protein
MTKFEVLLGMEQKIRDAVTTQFEELCGLKVVKKSVHDQFEVLCGLEQMIENDVMT